MAELTKAYRRLNITLPEKTVELVDQVAPRGDRSRVIAEAIRHYVTKARRTELKRRLKGRHRPARGARQATGR
jgi:metal-responsive CopG/Arc/MetJ family transcriptional regulator